MYMCASIMRIQPSNRTSSRMAQLYRITQKPTGKTREKERVLFSKRTNTEKTLQMHKGVSEPGIEEHEPTE